VAYNRSKLKKEKRMMSNIRDELEKLVTLSVAVNERQERRDAQLDKIAKNVDALINAAKNVANYSWEVRVDRSIHGNMEDYLETLDSRLSLFEEPE